MPCGQCLLAALLCLRATRVDMALTGALEAAAAAPGGDTCARCSMTWVAGAAAGQFRADGKFVENMSR